MRRSPQQFSLGETRAFSLEEDKRSRAHTLEETRALQDEEEPAAALPLILRVCTDAVGEGMQYAVCSM